MGGFRCEGACGPGEIPVTWTSGDTCCPGCPAFVTHKVPWCLNICEEELDAHLWQVFSSACVYVLVLLECEDDGFAGLQTSI